MFSKNWFSLSSASKAFACATIFQAVHRALKLSKSCQTNKAQLTGILGFQVSERPSWIHATKDDNWRMSEDPLIWARRPLFKKETMVSSKDIFFDYSSEGWQRCVPWVWQGLAWHSLQGHLQPDYFFLRPSQTGRMLLWVFGPTNMSEPPKNTSELSFQQSEHEVTFGHMPPILGTLAFPLRETYLEQVFPWSRDIAMDLTKIRWDEHSVPSWQCEIEACHGNVNAKKNAKLITQKPLSVWRLLCTWFRQKGRYDAMK